MSKTIEITLSSRSIKDAIDRLEEYRRETEKKADLLCRIIAQRIKETAQEGFSNSIADSFLYEADKPASVSVVKQDGDGVCYVVAQGKDAVFVEFGAGVYHNGAVGASPNPLGAGIGFTIGSYGKGNGAKNMWVYVDENGDKHFTHGTPASMPMYNAVQKVLGEAVEVAREVFAL